MIVLDSSFAVAAYNSRDAFHADATRLMRDLVDGRWGKALVLEYVFLETVSILKRKAPPSAALDAGQFLRRAHEIEFVAGTDLFQATWMEFQLDHITRLSFVDQAIVVTARQRAGGKILTFDKAFQDVPGITVEK